MIDCDVHNDWINADVLIPYMDPTFREYLVRGERVGGPSSFPHGHRPWLHPEGYRRADLDPAEGQTAGSDYEMMKRELLDKFDVEYAILTGEEIIDISTLANPYYAAAMARASNEYTIAEWLSQDSRLKGSLAVAPQDPVGAAEEIRRRGTHPDIVQVMLSSAARRPYGDPFYDPMWEAAAEVGIPIGIHLGGTGGVNSDSTFAMPPTFWRLRKVPHTSIHYHRMWHRLAARAALAYGRRLSRAAQRNPLAQTPAQRIRPRAYPLYHSATRTARQQRPFARHARSHRRQTHATLRIRLSTLGFRSPRRSSNPQRLARKCL